MKLEREALQHYLDFTFSSTEKPPYKSWEILGDDIEEMSVELNPDTEQKQNILGETIVDDKGYKPSMSADPYYADPSKKLYPKIREIAMGRLKGDKCKTWMLEAIIEDTDNSGHLAYAQEVVVKPQSYGGGTEGVSIPFNITECGTRIKGYVTYSSDGTPAFIGETDTGIIA